MSFHRRAGARFCVFANFLVSACADIANALREVSVFRFPRLTTGVSVAALLLCMGGAAQLRAEEGDGTYREIETKYIFGFTSGSAIGLEGEKEVSTDTIGRFGKRDGRYAATETKFEFEHTPTQFIQLEFGALVSSH